MTAVRFDPLILWRRCDGVRRDMGQTWREFAEEAGVPPSTCTRIGHGYTPSVDSLVRLLRHLGVWDMSAFVTTREME